MKTREAWRYGLLAVLVLTGAAMGGATAERDADLTAVQARHYRIYTDLPAEEVRDVARFLDEMFTCYAKVFRYRDSGRGKLDVYIFQKRGAFVSFGQARGFPNAAMSQGFFAPNLGLMACFGEGAPLRKVLAHEGTHQFITLVTKPTDQPPLWFHEGLATYFETAKWEKGKLTVGEVNPTYLAILAQARKAGIVIPLPLLLSAQNFGPLQYAEAWSFVHFLLEADNGRNADVLNNYFKLIQQGRDPVESFAQAFRAPLDKVQEAWLEYVNELVTRDLPTAGAGSGWGSAPPSPATAPRLQLPGSSR